MDMKRRIADLAGEMLKKAFPEAEGLPEDLYPLLEVPPDSSMGDYAFPCFKLSRVLRLGPPVIARKLAEALSELNEYDLVLLLGPDVAFVQDGDRSLEIAADRERFTGILKRMCEEHGLKVAEINGDYEERYRQAVALVDRLLEDGK